MQPLADGSDFLVILLFKLIVFGTEKRKNNGLLIVLVNFLKFVGFKIG